MVNCCYGCNLALLLPSGGLYCSLTMLPIKQDIVDCLSLEPGNPKIFKIIPEITPKVQLLKARPIKVKPIAKVKPVAKVSKKKIDTRQTKLF